MAAVGRGGDRQTAGGSSDGLHAGVASGAAVVAGGRVAGALLVQLSGRQMKRGKEYTTPALLAGLWVLLAMIEALEQHGVEELRQFKQMVLGAAEEDTG